MKWNATGCWLKSYTYTYFYWYISLFNMFFFFIFFSSSFVCICFIHNFFLLSVNIVWLHYAGWKEKPHCIEKWIYCSLVSRRRRTAERTEAAAVVEYTQAPPATTRRHLLHDQIPTHDRFMASYRTDWRRKQNSNRLDQLAQQNTHFWIWMLIVK